MHANIDFNEWAFIFRVSFASMLLFVAFFLLFVVFPNQRRRRDAHRKTKRKLTKSGGQFSCSVGMFQRHERSSDRACEKTRHDDEQRATRRAQTRFSTTARARAQSRAETTPRKQASRPTSDAQHHREHDGRLSIRQISHRLDPRAKHFLLVLFFFGSVCDFNPFLFFTTRCVQALSRARTRVCQQQTELASRSLFFSLSTHSLRLRRLPHRRPGRRVC